MSFLEALNARTHSMTFSPSVKVVNTAATPASRIFSPSSGVMTEPPMTTAMSDPRVLSSSTRCGAHVLPGMTGNPDDIGIFLYGLVGDGRRRMELAEILNLHLRLAQ